MRAIFAVVGVLALLVLGAVSFGLVDINQTRTAKLPDMDLKGGQTPAFKADVASVSIQTENKTMELPTIAVTNQTVALPTVKVIKPGQQTPSTPPASDAPKKN